MPPDHIPRSRPHITPPDHNPRSRPGCTWMNEVMAGMREAPPTSSTLLRGARAFGRMSGCICMAKCMENIHGKRCATAVCSQCLLSSLGLTLCSRFVSDCRRLVALLDCTVLPFYVLRCTVLLRRSAKLKSNSSSKTKKELQTTVAHCFPCIFLTSNTGRRVLIHATWAVEGTLHFCKHL